MTGHRTHKKDLWLLLSLAGLGTLALAARLAAAQQTDWDRLMEAAGEAYEQGRYAEAESQLKAALREAEKLGSSDTRMARTLNALAIVYHAQGRYAEAEPLYKRSLAIAEKTLGPEHPNVATALENYAELLRKTHREEEAERLEERARAIRAKQAAKNPPS